MNIIKHKPRSREFGTLCIWAVLLNKHRSRIFQAS